MACRNPTGGCSEQPDVAIGASFWVQYARTIRSSTMVEKNKDYVSAARLFALPSTTIMVRHIIPNVMGPVLVILTINFGLAIITEATLSYLGVGLPPMQPSLGTLIRIGQEYLFSGQWWIVAISHNLAVVRYMADMIGVMHHGKMVEMQPPSLLFSSPKDDYTRMLIDAVPQMSEAVRRSASGTS